MPADRTRRTTTSRDTADAAFKAATTRPAETRMSLPTPPNERLSLPEPSGALASCVVVIPS
jgi:hypothetical protein